MRTPNTPHCGVWECIQLAPDQIAICHRDTSRGGVETDNSGFLFEPFGECILSDTFVALDEIE